MNPSAPGAGPAPARRPFHGRRLLRALHRDTGYLVAGLTVVYAVSGIAVNHIEDWNPTWHLVREERRFAPMPVTDRETMTAELVRVLELPGPPRSAFRRAPEQIELFYDGWSVQADVTAGVASTMRPSERPLLGDANHLHLNHPRGAWTFVADAYGFLLAGLAISGLFMIRGRLGLRGRGKWLLAAGLALPALFLLLRRL